MSLRKNFSLLFCAITLLLAFVVPRQAKAVPQFARRYKVTCYACHTIPPVLNEQGYMFKRLGDHMPVPIQDGKRVQSLMEMIRHEPEFSLANMTSIAVSDTGYSAQKSTQQGAGSTSTSSITVNAWNAYFGGWIPDTHFFYYSEFDIVTGGQTSPNMPNAHFGYVGGTAKNSWYTTVGREHLSVAHGTRAANVYSLLPNSPLVFENMGPTNFVMDQSPVGADVGYTWTSSNYRNVLGVNVKVTNGDNPDGSEILGASSKNGKDVWADADWWYAPESGVSLVGYIGKKTLIQNSGTTNQFSFNPQIRRVGAFGNYMLLRDKVDLLGGFLRGDDGWQGPNTQAPGSYLTNGGFGEVDYYIQRGFALAARYDRVMQNLTGNIRSLPQEEWQVGVERAFTPTSNIVGRIAYGNQHGIDPLALTGSATRTVTADIQFNF